ncbi:MAG: ribbon-helix-helix domain-containing protein [Candidatus Bathyarchaeia archaeon]
MSEKKEKKSAKGHVTVKIPVELIREIDAMIGQFGFRSRGEFVKEAVRKLLDHYRNITPIQLPQETKKQQKIKD